MAKVWVNDKAIMVEEFVTLIGEIIHYIDQVYLCLQVNALYGSGHCWECYSSSLIQDGVGGGCCARGLKGGMESSINRLSDGNSCETEHKESQGKPASVVQLSV